MLQSNHTSGGLLSAQSMARTWLIWFSVLFGAYVFLPFLAPVLMALNLEGPARIIYTIYSFLCHQLPERSFYLFGEKSSYWAGEIAAVWPTGGSMALWRSFIGSETMGWKVAWSDRMVWMFTSILVFGWLWYPLRRRIRPLHWKGFLLFLLPMFIDGVTHLISDLYGLHSGFRFTNDWLAALTGNALPAWFYVGDAVGSLNFWMRLLTGLLFGLGTAWFSFPILDQLFTANADLERLKHEALTQIHDFGRLAQ